MLIAHLANEADPNEPGFAHSVALAARGHARLASVHACAQSAPPVDLPHASELLERWGWSADGVAHERIQHACCDAVDETLLDALHQLQPDILVASTHARSGLPRLLWGSVAEGVARNVRVPTLLLPLDGKQLLDPRSGTLWLSRVLLPVSNQQDAQRAVDAACQLSALAGASDVELVLLHVDDGHPAPEPLIPKGFAVQSQQVPGPIAHAVRVAADALDADLVVMVTHGHDGIGDVLLSSHTERVLHDCKRPLLWVPAFSDG